MSIFVFLTVIAAALLHASWNALIKGGADKRVSMGAMVLGHLPIALIAMVFVPLPHLESGSYIIAGIVLQMGYQLFLLQSYKIGDSPKSTPSRGALRLYSSRYSQSSYSVSHSHRCKLQQCCSSDLELSA